jgi:hypothetical protein
LIVEGDKERFLEFAKNLTTKGTVWLEAQFTNKLKGKTLFELLGRSFDILVPETFSSTNFSFPDEDSLIKEITKTPYSTIKQGAVAAQYPADAYPLKFEVEGVTRNYTVRSSSYRAGPKVADKASAAYKVYKQNRNISKMFKEVTGGKTKFALIVDATGGLALTDILNQSLSPDPEQECKFYIIQNIENSSDSADKVQNINPVKGASVAPSLFYMRDIGDTVIYPLWSTTETDQKSNIFASMQISLTRMKDGTVEGDLLVNGGQSFHIGDVANASNVKNASLAAAAIMVEKGIVPEVFVYTLIKRMGDWCQALSLLDLDRVYNVFNRENKVVEQATLRRMLVDTEIGVVTNDRILFAFCLLHGLNVFLTSAMDIARLIYFKNDNDVPQGPDLMVRADAIFTEASTQFAALRVSFDSMATQLNSLLLERIQQIMTTRSLPEYLALVKEFTVIASRLDTNILSAFDAQPEKADLDTFSQQYAAAKSAGDAPGMFSSASLMTALGGKLQTRLTVGKQAFERLQNRQYPGKSVIDVRIAALASKLAQGGRAPNSVAIVEARDTLVRVREDVEMIVKNVPAIVPSLREIFNRGFAPTLREETNYNEVLKGMIPTRLILPPPPPPPGGAPPAGGGQRGGATLDEVYSALRTRMIRLLPLGSAEATSTTNTYKRGADYIGEDMRSYTVVDEYIITKEDLPTFQLFKEEDPANPTSMYIKFRLYLLQFDMLRQRYANFNDSFVESVTPYINLQGIVDPERANEIDIMEPGTQLYETSMSIWEEFRMINTSIGRPVEYEVFPGSAATDAAFEECRKWFVAHFGDIPVDAVTRNAQEIYRYSDYYAQIVLAATAAALPRTLNIVTVKNGATVLNARGEGLSMVIRNAITSQNDEEAPINTATMNEQVVEALRRWLQLNASAFAPDDLLDAVRKRLVTAQSGKGRRKTHRRWGLPKLV